ncbi:MAG TPA: tetratricopeptide repeat protein [Candidatus Wujingus californicus]|uniref:tetratricopeptide repeat protein n=1 Tax=Candidatus Wujingus californicus TaxID=3367618 RepID=UPI001D1EA2C4|nr:hypothetical protein [Planctomycetota bacterium]MDO8094664.1 hypothetical protein [Candidatus Brocadiales bacterium]
MPLSDQEIKNLLEKAEAYIDSRDFEQSLKCYNQIIENVQPHPFYFKRCAFCHRMMGNMDKAIDNFNEALKLDSDDGVTYWERGACYNDKPYFEGIANEKKKNLLEKALQDYKASLERIPTSQEARLAVIDIDLCLLKFEDAIGHYGASKPYIQTKEYQLVRSWYGCLALTFAGDAIEEKDERALNDLSIRLKWNHWAFFSIDILFKELEQKGFDKERLKKAKKIHQKFVDHFDDQPFNPTV